MRALPYVALLSLVAGCVRPHAHGWRDASAEVGRDLPAAEVGATGDGAPAEAPVGLDAALADQALRPDLAEVSPGPVDGSPPSAQCQPRAIDCADPRTPRVCSEDGRFQNQAPCPADSECSAGVCRCSAGSCDEGVFYAPPNGLGTMSAAGDFLFFVYNLGVAQLNLRNRIPSLLGGAAEGFTPTGGLIADGKDSAYWCRRNLETDATELMYGSDVIDGSRCEELRLTRDHLYLRAGGEISRRALGVKGSLPVTSRSVTTFEVAGDQLYLAERLRILSAVTRVPLSAPDGGVELTSLESPPFDRLVLDAGHIYIAAGPRLLRIPLAGAKIQDVLWSDERAVIKSAGQTATHLYFVTGTAGPADGCLDSKVYRLPKGGGPAQLLLTVTDFCPADLVVHEDRLYVGVIGLPDDPARIYRLRQ